MARRAGYTLGPKGSQMCNGKVRQMQRDQAAKAAHPDENGTHQRLGSGIIGEPCDDVLQQSAACVSFRLNFAHEPASVHSRTLQMKKHILHSCRDATIVAPTMWNRHQNVKQPTSLNIIASSRTKYSINVGAGFAAPASYQRQTDKAHAFQAKCDEYLGLSIRDDRDEQ